MRNGTRLICFIALARITLFTVQGRDVTLRALSRVWFFENGVLSSGELAEDVIPDVRGKQVSFRGSDEDGMLIRFWVNS